MSPILTTGTVTMTRNAGTHLLITLAIAAALRAEPTDPSLPAGTEITLQAQLDTPIPPNGTVFALRIADRQVDEAALNAAATALKKQLTDASAAHADALDDVRTSYEKQLADQKAQLADVETQLSEARSELGTIRAALTIPQGTLPIGTDSSGKTVNELPADPPLVAVTSPAAPANDVQTSTAPAPASTAEVTQPHATA